jgi:uncharacterized damage-inducible protein DinB
MLTDLLRHQEWADAEHWRAILASAASRDDAAIRTRLHHIHLVQRAFAWIVGDRPSEFEIRNVEDFPDLPSLNVYAQDYYLRLLPPLMALSPEQLSRAVDVPWFRDPPLTLRAEQALLQCAMHSHYHRGQNATRLRELGGEPPLTDLIVWYWKDRPGPSWAG